MSNGWVFGWWTAAPVLLIDDRFSVRVTFMQAVWRVDGSDLCCIVRP
jgi:hypothetical protein